MPDSVAEDCGHDVPNLRLGSWREGQGIKPLLDSNGLNLRKFAGSPLRSHIQFDRDRMSIHRGESLLL